MTSISINKFIKQLKGRYSRTYKKEWKSAMRKLRRKDEVFFVRYTNIVKPEYVKNLIPNNIMIPVRVAKR